MQKKHSCANGDDFVGRARLVLDESNQRLVVHLLAPAAPTGNYEIVERRTVVEAVVRLEKDVVITFNQAALLRDEMHFKWRAELSFPDGQNFPWTDDIHRLHVLIKEHAETFSHGLNVGHTGRP